MRVHPSRFHSGLGMLCLPHWPRSSRQMRSLSDARYLYPSHYSPARLPRVPRISFGVVARWCCGVDIVMDKDTGRPKGFAFVEMTEASEADKACLALSGSDLGGRALRVNEAKAKRQ